MLTLKHVEREQGVESIVQAISMSTVPAGDSWPHDAVSQVAYQDHHDLGTCMNVPGTVYVMNENGKTVGTYRIVNHFAGQPGPCPPAK